MNKLFGQVWHKVKAKMRNALSSPSPVSDGIDQVGKATDYFIKSGYASRLMPEYFQDTPGSSDGKTYQPDVYRMAEAFGKFASAKYLIDVGCGRATKLSALSDQFEIIGLDYGDNIEYCRSTFQYGTWIDHDFEKDAVMPVTGVELSSALVVCADVIEHLIDPLPLLSNLKRFADDGALIVLSTPERVLVQGMRDLGPPVNLAHVREWSIAELRALLISVGFRIAFMGLTADNDEDREMSTIIAVLSS